MSVRSLLVVSLLLSGCATIMPVSSESERGPAVRRPVLLVHGIDDDARKLRKMRDYLAARGWTQLELIELTPNDGSSGLPALAEEVDRSARALALRSGAPEIDVVAFSMGALVSRYWIKRVDSSVRVHSFVSISGPHHGTWMGWLRFNAGAKQMRPSSPLIRDLERDEGEWRGVRAFSFWTPMDLMIVPASSSRLKGAVERTFPVVAHPLMVWDGRVLAAVEEALAGGTVRAPDALDEAPSWP